MIFGLFPKGAEPVTQRKHYDRPFLQLMEHTSKLKINFLNQLLFCFYPLYFIIKYEGNMPLILAFINMVSTKRLYVIEFGHIIELLVVIKRTFILLEE